MDKRKIATSSIAPMLLIGVAGVAPATASAMQEGMKAPNNITRAEWEEGVYPTRGGASPDLCYFSCSGNWGAYEHAVHDAFEYGDYNELKGTVCTNENPSAKRGQKEWWCGGYGHYEAASYFFSLYLSPYGYSIDGKYPN